MVKFSRFPPHLVVRFNRLLDIVVRLNRCPTHLEVRFSRFLPQISYDKHKNIRWPTSSSYLSAKLARKRTWLPNTDFHLDTTREKRNTSFYSRAWVGVISKPPSKPIKEIIKKLTSIVFALCHLPPLRLFFGLRINKVNAATAFHRNKNARRARDFPSLLRRRLQWERTKGKSFTAAFRSGLAAADDDRPTLNTLRAFFVREKAGSRETGSQDPFSLRR